MIKVTIPEDQRLANIAEAVRLVKSGGVKTNEKYKNFVEDMKAEKATEDFIVKHGLSNVNKKDIEEEIEELDAKEEKIDHDQDESEVDMSIISKEMRGI
jgi:hypothetical protein